MDNKQILKIAMKQSAVDIGCQTEDFMKTANIIVPFKLGTTAKKYYSEPIGCNFISYGNNVVVGSCDALSDIVYKYIKNHDFYHCFETPNTTWLNKQLLMRQHTIWLQAEYFLPDLNNLPSFTCNYEIRVLDHDGFEHYFLPQWSNAICGDRKYLNNLGIGGFDGGKLIGLAGCTEDSEDMWQVGIDVLPEYRREGIAAALTSRLTVEILERGKIPFLNTAWSNIRSSRSAIKCGYIPSWIEMTIKPKEIVDCIYNFPEI